MGDATPPKGMSYNVRIGTTPGGSNVVSPMSVSSGTRLSPGSGNAQSDTLFILKYPKKVTYYWSVQAIDNGYGAGAFASEQSVSYTVSLQASQVIASNIQASGLTLNWCRGNGLNCDIFIGRVGSGRRVGQLHRPTDQQWYSLTG